MEETPLQEPDAQDEQPAPVRRLTRVHDGRWFGGVCAGLGRYFDVSPAVYRIVFAALALAGGTGILLYLAAWLVIPDEGTETSAAEQALRDHRDRPGFVVGIGLIAFAAIIVLAHAAVWPHPGNLWLAALIVGAGLVWWEMHGGKPATVVAASGEGGTTTMTAPQPRRQSFFLPVVGALLAVAGIFGLLSALDIHTVDVRILLAASVVAVGAAIAGGAMTQRSVAGLVGLGLLLLAALSVALVLHVPFRGGLGDHRYDPSAAADIRSHYRLAAGNLTLDLRDVSLTHETVVELTVAVGNLRVYVPARAHVDVTGKAHVGQVRLFGHEDNGTGIDSHVSEPGNGQHLVLKAEVGAGNVEVTR